MLRQKLSRDQRPAGGGGRDQRERSVAQTADRIKRGRLDEPAALSRLAKPRWLSSAGGETGLKSHPLAARRVTPSPLVSLRFGLAGTVGAGGAWVSQAYNHPFWQL